MNGIDKQRILRRIANMSDDDKDSHIQMVEITIDYGFGSTLSDEDIAIYKILTNKRSKGEIKNEIGFPIWY